MQKFSMRGSLEHLRKWKYVERDGMILNEAEEAGWCQILQGLLDPVKDFSPYSVSSEMDAVGVL